MEKHTTYKYALLAMLAWLVSTPSYAVDTSPIIVASASSAPRFMSLAGVRNGTSGVRVVAPLRSDRIAMQNGFMRIDRTQTVRSARPVVATTRAAATAPVAVTRPQDSAVLDLFGESAAQAPQLQRVAAGKHAWPLPVSATQKFTSGYGVRNDPFHGNAGFHDGVDLSAPTGTPVLASADGVVSEVASAARFGNYVRIEHRDGTRSSYGHLSRQLARVGQRVRQGDKIGEVGSSGRSTGPHLHYALTRLGHSADPMTVLNAPAQTGIRVATNVERSGVKVVRR